MSPAAASLLPPPTAPGPAWTMGPTMYYCNYSGDTIVSQLLKYQKKFLFFLHSLYLTQFYAKRHIIRAVDLLPLYCPLSEKMVYVTPSFVMKRYFWRIYNLFSCIICQSVHEGRWMYVVSFNQFSIATCNITDHDHSPWSIMS